jgi:hypothetical protein
VGYLVPVRTLRSVALLWGVACLSLGCHGDSGGSQAYLDIVNSSASWHVTNVYIVPSSGNVGWGSDWLTSNIGPGENRTLSVDPDTYDIRILTDHPLGPVVKYGLVFTAGRAVVVTVSELALDVQP